MLIALIKIQIILYKTIKSYSQLINLSYDRVNILIILLKKLTF